MKKFIFYLFTVALFCSCSNGFENEAKKQMEKTFHEIAKDPSSVSFNNVKVMFDNDSICIINLNMSAKNGFGAIATKKFEYVYLIDTKDSTKCKREMVIDLSEEESVMNKARKDYQSKRWDKGSLIDKMSDEEKKAYYIYFNAHLLSIFNSRKVEYDKNDIENW